MRPLPRLFDGRKLAEPEPNELEFARPYDQVIGLAAGPSRLSLLKIPSGHRLGLSMKAMVDDVRKWKRAPSSCGAASLHRFWARLPLGDGIADRDDDRCRNRGAGSVIANRYRPRAARSDGAG